MVNQTYSVLINVSPDPNLLFFVFFSTLCSYRFHWYLASENASSSPRIIWTAKHRPLYVIIFFIGIAGALFLFFRLWHYWYWLGFSAFVTFLYSAPQIPGKYFRMLRKVALGKTIFLAFVWMYVTTILPIIISEQPWRGDFI